MTGKKTHISDAVFFRIAFVFSICMLLFIGTLSVTQLRKVNEAQELLIASRNRQVALANLYALVKDAEGLQRAYIITADSFYLNAYSASRHKAAVGLKQLKSMSRQHPLRNNDLNMLGKLITSRFDIMDASLKLHRDKVPDSVLQAQLKEGAMAMKKIDALVATIHRNEDAALRLYDNLHASKRMLLPYTTVFLVVFSLLIFFISFYKISRDSRRITQMNHDLLLTNRNFQNAEEMSQMGHWKRNLADLSIEASDNMYRLLGLEPGAIPYTEETLLKLVHPDDISTMTDAFKDVKDKQIPPNVSYRIIRPDGTIRSFSTSARLFDLEGTPVVLGATRDITSDVENRQHIEQKNKELEQLVKELESFNHVASHDLQEPLRKIQVFISRILNEESDSLTENARTYFERISVSALRMENLIDDLLLYSQSGRENEVYETYDLNLIIREALHELAPDIEAKNAVITFDKLPTLPVIPFQIRQLFINLLSNSLKYSKTDVAPVIAISCKKVKDAPAGKADRRDTYYEISVKDNGIGFLQEYAEKIFILFHRLHSKTKYSGTGIGLAICKKIMENHGGQITAHSTPGDGATFRFYLPK